MTDALDGESAAFLGHHGFDVALSVHDEGLDGTGRARALQRRVGVTPGAVLVAVVVGVRVEIVSQEEQNELLEALKALGYISP